ncbi:carbon storage regulator [Microbulbifer epialgicus]|uniref:Carbon storage regulator n=1 Tax=Microbulbifer epialgicus TaxID=393907 RepID=A0ABV4P4I5_9GAMM
MGTYVPLTLPEVKDNQVEIGIHALKSLHIHREEIYVRIKREQKVGNRRR